MQTIKLQITASILASGAPSAKKGSLRAIDTDGAIGMPSVSAVSRHSGCGDAIQGRAASCSCRTKAEARVTITAKPSSGRCSRRSLRGDTTITPSPRTMHQNAIAAGAVEPKGNGAAATVTKRMKDEIRFDGARVAVVMFPSDLKRTSIATSAAIIIRSPHLYQSDRN